MITIKERPAAESECRRAYELTEPNPIGVLGCFVFAALPLALGLTLYLKHGKDLLLVIVAVGALGMVGAVWLAVLEFKTRKKWLGSADGFDVIRIEMPVHEVWRVRITQDELDRLEKRSGSEDRHGNTWLFSIAPGRYAYLGMVLVAKSVHTKNFIPRSVLTVEWVRPPKGRWKPLAVTSSGNSVAIEKDRFTSKDLPAGTYVLDGGIMESDTVSMGEQLVTDLRAGFFDDIEIDDQNI